MNRFFPHLLLTVIFTIVLSGIANATTYYVAANGADSNNGTSKSTPWAHAPGMSGCTSTCASSTPKAGDQFIFRGGDIWHLGSFSGSIWWQWQWSGTSSNYIYIGVDNSWYSGASWKRPIITGDNPLSATKSLTVGSTIFTVGDFVSPCAHDQTNIYWFAYYNASYVQLDNFEFTGRCWAGSGNVGVVVLYHSSYTKTTNNYFHGWTATLSSGDTNTVWGVGTGDEVSYNVLDGQDSSVGTTSTQCAGSANGPPCASGGGLNTIITGGSIHHNIVRWMSNNEFSTASFHDNRIEYMYNVYGGGQHPNAAEWNGNGSGTDLYFYNNLLRHNQQNVNYWPMGDKNLWQFNNVLYDNWTSAPANCFMQSPATTSGSSTVTAYVFNNTLTGNTNVSNGCLVQFFPGNGTTPAWNNRPANFQNNHYLNYSSTLSATYVGSAAIADSGGHVFSTNSQAGSQGYTDANDYAPNAGSCASGGTCATVGAGVNGTSWCNGMSDVNGKTACQAGASFVTYDAVNHVVVLPSSYVQRPTSGAWDAGAYESGSTTTQLNPPTGLAAVVN